jgi:PAS domain S-box-containing protein
VQHAPEAVIMADREGLIRVWNAGAEAIFGYPAPEALGRSLDLIIPDRFRARHWDGFRKVMETGDTRYGAELLNVPAICKDQTRISASSSKSADTAKSKFPGARPASGPDANACTDGTIDGSFPSSVAARCFCSSVASGFQLNST